MTKTTTSAQDSLAAMLAVSKQFTGFSLGDSLQQEIKNSLALTGANGAEGNRRSAAVELRLRTKLSAFFAGSPKFFGGKLAGLRKEVDGDLAAQVAAVLGKFAAAAQRPLVSAENFSVAAKQFAAMEGVFFWAQARQAARVAAKQAARVAVAEADARRIAQQQWAVAEVGRRMAEQDAAARAEASRQQKATATARRIRFAAHRGQQSLAAGLQQALAA